LPDYGIIAKDREGLRTTAQDPMGSRTTGWSRSPAASSKPTRQIEESANILGVDSPWTSRSVAVLPGFQFMDSLVAGPGAVLDQVIRCVQALQFEACVPPVLFDLKTTLPSEASILNLTYTGSGSNAG
jgi:hypothetical protein